MKGKSLNGSGKALTDASRLMRDGVIQVQKVDGIEMVFGGDMRKLLPPMDQIPAEFKQAYNPFAKTFSSLFFNGGDVSGWKAKPGIDKPAALGHLKAVMVSFEPKHEHKEAGCAFMLASWFEPESMGIEAPKARGEASEPQQEAK